jgi:hypothetical protein
MAHAETTIDAAFLRTLEIGYAIEAGQVMPGLCKEKFCYTLVDLKAGKTLYQFEASAFGIFMFTAYAKITGDNKIIWELET